MSSHDDLAYKLVEVSWHDTFGQTEWVNPESWKDPGHALCKTVGYLIPGLKDGYVVLVGTVMEQQEGWFWHDLSLIPEGIVVDVKPASKKMPFRKFYL